MPVWLFSVRRFCATTLRSGSRPFCFCSRPYGRLTSAPISSAAPWVVRCVAARQPEEDLVGRLRRIGRGGCRRSVGRLCERRNMADHGRDFGFDFVGRRANRRSVRVGGQTALRRQRRQRTYPRPWRRDGPARWFSCCRGGCGRHCGFAAWLGSGPGCARGRIVGMVSRLLRCSKNGPHLKSNQRPRRAQ